MPNKCHRSGISRAAGLVRCAGAALLALALAGPGCRSTQKVAQGAEKVVDTSGEAARDLVRKIDVTGATDEAARRGELWKTAQTRLEELDVEQLNATVAQLQQLAIDVRLNVEQLQPEAIAQLGTDLTASASAVREQLQAAPVHETVTRVLDVAETIDAKLKVLELERLNELLADAQTGVAELRAAVTRLNERLTQNLDQTQTVLTGVSGRLDDLPVEQLQGTLTQAQQTLAALNAQLATLPELQSETQHALRGVAWVFTWASVALGAIALCALCGAVYLIRRALSRGRS